MKNTKIYIVLFLSLVLFSCKKQEEKMDYLSPWIGTYDGTARSWSSYPSGGTYMEYEDFKDVSVDIQHSDLDSCLKIMITYDNVAGTPEDIHFSNEKKHSEQWGGGSSYGSLNIQLVNDSLKYHRFQKCGIPCSSGLDFEIKKN